MILHITPMGIVKEENEELSIIKFSDEPEEAGEIFYKLMRGDRDLIKKYIESYITDKTVLSSPNLYSILNSIGLKVELDKGKKINIIDIFIKTGLAGSIEEAKKILNRAMASYTTLKLREEMTNKDLLIIHAINAYDEYTETINLFYERLREWYGVYFPELSDYISKIDSYTNLVYNLLQRENFNIDNLVKYGYSIDKAEKIVKAARNSLGGLLSREDLEAIKLHAEELKKLIIKRDNIEDYLKKLLDIEAPNITALVGYKLAARLIAKAGGLRRLASYPASTIQLLGAEKSLFLALRKGGKPPKHGLIFQHPFINQSPRVIRGKVARLLASKIAIAARVDAFGGEFIGEKLYEEVRERVEELRKHAPKLAEKKGKKRFGKRVKKGLRKKKRR